LILIWQKLARHHMSSSKNVGGGVFFFSSLGRLLCVGAKGGRNWWEDVFLPFAFAAVLCFLFVTFTCPLLFHVK
jgi:hypothetical protein